jgi:hypothetical protein
VTARRRRRTRHAASRARKITAMVSVFAFVAIGRAIDLTSGTATTAQTGAVAQSAASPASSSSASNRSASVSAASGTTTAVTSTHAS